MAFRTLFLAANLPVLFGILLWRGKVPRDGEEFKNGLKRLKLKPGPLGYFNSAYMAFTRAQADRFLNLVSYRSKLRRMKTYNITLESQVPVQSTTSRLKRDESCESTIGGLKRLCDVCPAVTDLGPGKSPRYINEVLCDEEQMFCGEGNVVGQCLNTAVTQSFLMKVNSTWEVYSQEIRVCCECALFV